MTALSGALEPILDLANLEDVIFWADELEVSVDSLRAAAFAVGNTISDIEAYFAQRK